MSRYVAFLRAINVGGRTVKMASLREIFAQVNLTNVETFIASGNVLFSSRVSNEEALRDTIEKMLVAELGFSVTTFVRREDEIRRIASFAPFPQTRFDTPLSRLFVAFLSDKLTSETTKRLLEHNSATDEFHVNGREIYWLCHVAQSDSAFSGPKPERLLGQTTTVRNFNTDSAGGEAGLASLP